MSSDLHVHVHGDNDHTYCCSKPCAYPPHPETPCRHHEEDAVAGLMAAEDRASGAVGWPVYAAYLRACGWGWPGARVAAPESDTPPPPSLRCPLLAHRGNRRASGRPCSIPPRQV